MNAAVRMDRIAETSPRLKARITGLLFLLTIATGIVALWSINSRLVVPGDAAATAANILAHKTLFQLGFTLYLVEMACNIAITALFYDLLKPVSRSVSLLAAFFGLVGCVLKTFARLFYIAPLLVLEDSRTLTVFSREQSQALALLLLQVNDQGAGMGLAFFGFSTVLKGYLILRSTFLPRILGALSVLSGLGWLTFLYPPLGYRLFPYMAGIGLLGSALMISWLLVVGVNEERWKEQASAAAKSIWI